MTFGGFNNLVYILKLFKNYKMTNNELVPYACDQWFDSRLMHKEKIWLGGENPLYVPFRFFDKD
jgi:hypothetical protein